MALPRHYWSCWWCFWSFRPWTIC